MAKVLTRKAASRSAESAKPDSKKPGSKRTLGKLKSVQRNSHLTAKSSGRALKQRPGSKQEQVLQMLIRPAGVTIEGIMAATGWQAHSVRGFFAGVVRKKLQLTLTSETADRGRVYRVANNVASITAASEKPALSAA